MGIIRNHHTPHILFRKPKQLTYTSSNISKIKFITYLFYTPLQLSIIPQTKTGHSLLFPSVPLLIYLWHLFLPLSSLHLCPYSVVIFQTILYTFYLLCLYYDFLCIFLLFLTIYQQHFPHDEFNFVFSINSEEFSIFLCSLYLLFTCLFCILAIKGEDSVFSPINSQH